MVQIIRTKNDEKMICPFCSFSGCCEHFDYSKHIENKTIWETHWASANDKSNRDETLLKAIDGTL
jgi:hypothetical protein